MSSELKANKVSPATGTDVTLGDASDTFTIPSGGTLTVASGATINNSGTALGFGGENSPRFEAFLSGNQTGFSDATYTKVQFNGENYDIGSCYDSTNHRFVVPAGEAGTYFFYASVNMGAHTSGQLAEGRLSFYKNGSNTAHARSRSTWANVPYTMSFSIQMFLALVATDYIEVFGYDDISTTNTIFTADQCWFGGFKLV